MEKYKILEHPADLKIEIYGRTKKELFSNAVLAMNEGLEVEFGRSKSEIRNIKIKSLDLESLLVDFLNEVLYLIQVNKEVYNQVRFIKFTDEKIKAELFGYKLKRINQDIKAVTYYDLKISQRKDNSWKAIVVFDI